MSRPRPEGAPPAWKANLVGAAVVIGAFSAFYWIVGAGARAGRRPRVRPRRMS